MNIKAIQKNILSYEYDGSKIILTSLADDFDLYRYEQDEWKYCYGEFAIKKSGKLKCVKKNDSYYEFLLEVTVYEN